MRDFPFPKFVKPLLLLSLGFFVPMVAEAGDHSKITKIAKITVYPMSKAGVRQGTVEVLFTDATTAFDNYAPSSCARDKAWLSILDYSLHAALLSFWSMGIPMTVTVDATLPIVGGACQITGIQSEGP